MIHRQNWLDVRDYLHHIERVRQNDPETVKRARSHLRHLLEWADESPLPKARGIDPTFPTYLLTARSDGKEKSLASASIIKCLANARQFFSYARSEWPLRYKTISESWIELLQPPRQVRSEAHLPVLQAYTLEDVKKIATIPTETLREERGKVAVCMLFLSGMRADALASLPISCVDLANQAVHQLPERGVRTKNRKAAITYLLQIPELLQVVQSWHARISHLPPDALWYATLSTDGMKITTTMHAFEGRNNAVERDVKIICKRAGIPYLSPHKLRHGHVVYALKQAHNLVELKAISQNVMHNSVTVTDGIYGNLIDNDVKKTITRLGQAHIDVDIESKLEELLRILRQS
jgi:site-specific recombinase XerD